MRHSMDCVHSAQCTAHGEGSDFSCCYTIAAAAAAADRCPHNGDHPTGTPPIVL